MRIIGLSHPASVASGEFFFNEGDPAGRFLVLTSGHVKLIQLSPDGHQVVLRIIGPGEAFGSAGAFDQGSGEKGEQADPAPTRARFHDIDIIAAASSHSLTVYALYKEGVCKRLSPA